MCSDPHATLFRPCSNLTGSELVGGHIRSDHSRIRVGTGQIDTRYPPPFSPGQVRASVSQQLRFHNTAASRRRAVVQIVPEPSTRPPAHVPMCPERRESMGAAVQAITALQCSLALRRCATAAKHVWTSRTVLLRCSRLAARSRPTTRSTRGSWRGLTHDLCHPSAGPAAVSQRASFLAPSC